MLLRSASITDLPAVCEIENVSFSVPWTTDSFRAGLSNSHTRFLVAEHNAVISGYVYAWLVVDELQILRVAVHLDMRRDGVASVMLRELITQVSQEGAKTASLEVRKGNGGARALYQKLGFSEVAIRPHYYDDGEDAVLLTKDLTGETGCMTKSRQFCDREGSYSYSPSKCLKKPPHSQRSIALARNLSCTRRDRLRTEAYNTLAGRIAALSLRSWKRCFCFARLRRCRLILKRVKESFPSKRLPNIENVCRTLAKS